MAVREQIIPSKIGPSIGPSIGQIGLGKPPEKHIIQMPVKSPRSEDGKRVSKEVYWADYYEHPDFVYEWNNGILEEKPMAKIVQSDMYLWFLLLLRTYLRVHPIARLIMLEIGFELPLKDGDRVRIPDLGVVRHDNSVPAGPDDHKYKGIFDLCIESLSDSNIRQIQRDVKKKKVEYAEIGVKEYYILDDRRNRHMNFYRRTALGIYVPIKPTEEGVIRSSVLPGFQFDIEDLYLQPELDELVDDPIYQGFIWPEYLVEKERADSAEERADSAEEQIKVLQSQTEEVQKRADGIEEQIESLQNLAESEKARAQAEKERADAAILEAERYAAKLRELGIDIE